MSEITNQLAEFVADLAYDDLPVDVTERTKRLLAPGGYALHQVDFRDHRDFSQPRAFLRYGSEEWAARGLAQVFYIPAAISADAIHSQADIPELVAEARVPESFPRINLGAWNNDPLTITAIKTKIDAQLTGQDAAG